MRTSKIEDELYGFVQWKQRKGYGFTTPEHYHEILEKQLEEYQEHIENGEMDKAMNEMIDTFLLSFEVLYAANCDIEDKLQNRSYDIKQRYDEIIDKYSQE